MRNKTIAIEMTESRISRAAKPENGYTLRLKDKKLNGLYLLVGTSGRATWFLRRKVDGRDRTFNLGVYRGGINEPVIVTYAVAVKSAHKIIGQGAAMAPGARGLPTLAEVWEAWSSANPRDVSDATMANNRSYWKHLKALGHIRLDKLKPAHFADLRTATRDSAGARTSNKVVELGRLVLDWGLARAGAEIPNPARDPSVGKSKENGMRTRFLRADERPAFIRAVRWYQDVERRWKRRACDWRDAAVAAGVVLPHGGDSHPDQVLSLTMVRDAAERVHELAIWEDTFEEEFGWDEIRMRYVWPFHAVAADIVMAGLLTGARSSNVRTMRWDEIDMSTWTWVIPGSKTKTGEPYILPLEPSHMVPLLQSRLIDARLAGDDSPYVFAHPRTGEPLRSIRKSWARICQRAGVRDLRVHDLRRTVGSVMMSQGVNQRMIAAALCHSDTESTDVYTHMESPDSLREHFAAAAHRIMGD